MKRMKTRFQMRQKNYQKNENENINALKIFT